MIAGNNVEWLSLNAAVPPSLPPPNRNRLLPISITLSSGRNPRTRGFGWGRVGVGGREVTARPCPPYRPPPQPSPQGGGEEFAAPLQCSSASGAPLSRGMI